MTMFYEETYHYPTSCTNLKAKSRGTNSLAQLLEERILQLNFWKNEYFSSTSGRTNTSARLLEKQTLQLSSWRNEHFDLTSEAQLLKVNRVKGGWRNELFSLTPEGTNSSAQLLENQVQMAIKTDLSIVQHVFWYISTLPKLPTINNLICGFLPIFEGNSSGSLISIATDYLNNIECIPNEYDKQFRHYTNLPSELLIRTGARIIFLTNKLFNEELCNRSIGVITKLIDEDHIEVTFLTKSGITQVIVKKITAYFNLNGASAYRTSLSNLKV
ncbi:hypothetical protein C1645_829905 [Glomus cerebriforme]|uniref:Uncharacterized protein n=1 Tax=Glomus cerebriforme TaxID=658196 RepID=A0A397SN53_9GLOM|nr:hypothetical protein C1645_829905 [Glomus cerebriforme]